MLIGLARRVRPSYRLCGVDCPCCPFSPSGLRWELPGWKLELVGEWRATSESRLSFGPSDIAIVKLDLSGTKRAKFGEIGGDCVCERCLTSRGLRYDEMRGEDWIMAHASHVSPPWQYSSHGRSPFNESYDSAWLAGCV